MAFPYEKKDPATGRRRWYARIKIAGKWESVSLNLLAPDSKRLAAARANRLQTECDQGSLSPETREWLSERPARRLTALLARGGRPKLTGTPTDWASAMEGYLTAKAPQDTRGHFEGKAVADEEHGKYQRRANLRRFVTWADKTGVRLGSESFTDTLIRYLTHRLETVTGNTIRTSDYPYLIVWGEWMARKHLVDRPDRDRILEIVPPKVTPDITLPPWRDDLDALRYFHAHRNDPIRGSTWRATKGLWSAWGLVLVVRGFGCRPSEAISLDWSTVDLANNRVRFLRSKTGGHRIVPILFSWVAEGLSELAARNGTVGAVCLSAVDQPYSRETIAAGLIHRVCEAAVPRLPVYRLKNAQKLWIRHAITTGFPPHVVARWADHTLSVQERHYAGAEGYLPPDQDEDYGPFGTLTEFGKRTREHLGAFSRDFDLD